MDQSEEGIIIMNDQTIEYINDTFIRQQCTAIQQSIANNNSDIITKQSKFKSYVKRIFCNKSLD
jgi:hypothetical protein